MLRLGKISIFPGFLCLIVVSLFAGAGEVLPLAGLAALLHELGHMAALRLVGVHVEGICLTAFGAEIFADTRYLSYQRDILCTLAGPLVNIVLGMILARTSGDYLFAGANLLQGSFNLLPISGLDGARVLRLLVSWVLDPIAADRICGAVEAVFAVVFAVAAFYLVLCHHVGAFLLLAAFGILRGAVRGWQGK